MATALISDIKELAFRGELVPEANDDLSSARDNDDDSMGSAFRGATRRGADDGRWLGLCSELVSLAELAAAKAVLQAEVLRLAVVGVGSQLRGFFTWLYQLWSQLEGTKVRGMNELDGLMDKAHMTFQMANVPCHSLGCITGPSYTMVGLKYTHTHTLTYRHTHTHRGSTGGRDL